MLGKDFKLHELYDNFILKVSGLPEGKYELLHDDSLVGAFTSSELASGARLDPERLPSYAVSKQLWHKSFKRLQDRWGSWYYGDVRNRNKDEKTEQKRLETVKNAIENVTMQARRFLN